MLCFSGLPLDLLKMLHCLLLGHSVEGRVGSPPFSFWRVFFRFRNLVSFRFYACALESSAAVSVEGLVWFVCFRICSDLEIF